MLFGSAKKRSVLGVDIGSRATKLVQFKFSGKGGPEFEVCELLNTGFTDESFSSSLQAYLTDAKLNNSLAAVSFEDDSLIIRKFELPKMPDEELIEAIRWNLRDHVDEDLSLYTVTFSEIDIKRNEEDTLRHYLAYAVKRQAVADFKLRMEQLGLAPFMVEPRDVTLASALDRCFPDEEHYHAGVDIGYHSSRFFVVGRRSFSFTRYLPIICYKNYEDNADEFRKKLAIEIQKSIDTFQVNFQMEPIQSIHLCGAGALVPELTDYLQKNLGIETGLLNPFTSIQGVENFPEMKPELFAQAVSLAFLEP